jgi:hypothetical protein
MIPKSALDPVYLQQKAAVAYEIARETVDPYRPERTTLFQILAAHQSALARRHAGVTE